MDFGAETMRFACFKTQSFAFNCFNFLLLSRVPNCQFFPCPKNVQMHFDFDKNWKCLFMHKVEFRFFVSSKSKQNWKLFSRINFRSFRWTLETADICGWKTNKWNDFKMHRHGAMHNFLERSNKAIAKLQSIEELRRWMKWSSQPASQQAYEYYEMGSATLTSALYTRRRQTTRSHIPFRKYSEW